MAGRGGNNEEDLKSRLRPRRSSRKTYSQAGEDFITEDKMDEYIGAAEKEQKTHHEEEEENDDNEEYQIKEMKSSMDLDEIDNPQLSAFERSELQIEKVSRKLNNPLTRSMFKKTIQQKSLKISHGPGEDEDGEDENFEEENERAPRRRTPRKSRAGHAQKGPLHQPIPSTRGRPIPIEDATPDFSASPQQEQSATSEEQTNLNLRRRRRSSNQQDGNEMNENNQEQISSKIVDKKTVGTNENNLPEGIPFVTMDVDKESGKPEGNPEQTNPLQNVSNPNLLISVGDTTIPMNDPQIVDPPKTSQEQENTALPLDEQQLEHPIADLKGTPKSGISGRPKAGGTPTKGRGRKRKRESSHYRPGSKTRRGDGSDDDGEYVQDEQSGSESDSVEQDGHSDENDDNGGHGSEGNDSEYFENHQLNSPANTPAYGGKKRGRKPKNWHLMQQQQQIAPQSPNPSENGSNPNENQQQSASTAQRYSLRSRTPLLKRRQSSPDVDTEMPQPSSKRDALPNAVATNDPEKQRESYKKKLRKRAFPVHYSIPPMGSATAIDGEQQFGGIEIENFYGMDNEMGISEKEYVEISKYERIRRQYVNIPPQFRFAAESFSSSTFSESDSGPNISEEIFDFGSARKTLQDKKKRKRKKKYQLGGANSTSNFLFLNEDEKEKFEKKFQQELFYDESSCDENVEDIGDLNLPPQKRFKPNNYNSNFKTSNSSVNMSIDADSDDSNEEETNSATKPTNNNKNADSTNNLYGEQQNYKNFLQNCSVAQFASYYGSPSSTANSPMPAPTLISSNIPNYPTITSHALSSNIFGPSSTSAPSNNNGHHNNSSETQQITKKKRSEIGDLDPLDVDPSITFDSIGGLKNHVQSLKEMIVLPLTFPDMFSRFGIEPPRGVLFSGPPGTGKTLVARALANVCCYQSEQNQSQDSSSSNSAFLMPKKKISFFMRKGADVLSKWVGESEKQLRLLFEKAKNCAPSIIFFDEIDGLAPVRSSKQDYIHSSIVSTLLALMDGLDSRGKDVILIGATNRADAIDPALRRPGRFDRELVFTLPDSQERLEILKIHTKKWVPQLSDPLLRELVEKTVGFSGADLRALCAESAIQAVKRVYPFLYSNNDVNQASSSNLKIDAEMKKKIDINKIQVTKDDFGQSFKKLIPTSQRSANNYRIPLPKEIKPVLQTQLQEALSHISRIFPSSRNLISKCFEKNNNLLASLSETADSTSSKDKSKVFFETSFEDPPSFCSYLLLTPENDENEEENEEGKSKLSKRPFNSHNYIGRAILHILESFSVFPLSIADLVSYPSGKSLSEAIIKIFSEARKSTPCIVWIPDIEKIFGSNFSPDSEKMSSKAYDISFTLFNCLKDLKIASSTLHILVLATTSKSKQNLPKFYSEIFENNSFVLKNPNNDENEESKAKYFAEIKKLIKEPITERKIEFFPKATRQINVIDTNVAQPSQKEKKQQVLKIKFSNNVENEDKTKKYHEKNFILSMDFLNNLLQKICVKELLFRKEEETFCRKIRIQFREAIFKCLLDKKLTMFALPKHKPEILPRSTSESGEKLMYLYDIIEKIERQKYVTISQILKDIDYIVRNSKNYAYFDLDYEVANENLMFSNSNHNKAVQIQSDKDVQQHNTTTTETTTATTTTTTTTTTTAAATTTNQNENNQEKAPVSMPNEEISSSSLNSNLPQVSIELENVDIQNIGTEKEPQPQQQKQAEEEQKQQIVELKMINNSKNNEKIKMATRIVSRGNYLHDRFCELLASSIPDDLIQKTRIIRKRRKISKRKTQYLVKRLKKLREKEKEFLANPQEFMENNPEKENNKSKDNVAKQQNPDEKKEKAKEIIEEQEEIVKETLLEIEIDDNELDELLEKAKEKSRDWSILEYENFMKQTLQILHEHRNETNRNSVVKFLGQHLDCSE